MTITTKKGLPVDDEMLDAWADDFESGEWPEGKTTLMGRPRISGEELVSVTIKIPRSQVEAIDGKTKNRSDFIRSAIASCL